MKISYVLNEIRTGKNVKFLLGEITSGTRTGDKVVILNDLDRNKKFVIGASLNNFSRFRKWVDKEAIADYDPYFKLVKTDHGKLACARLSTTVEIDDYKERPRDWEDYDI